MQYTLIQFQQLDIRSAEAADLYCIPQNEELGLCGSSPEPWGYGETAPVF